MELSDVDARRAFDALGRPLKVVDDGSWPVDLLLPEDAEAISDELRLRVTEFIRSVGHERVDVPDLETASLQELLEGLLRFQSGAPYKSTMSMLLKKLRVRRAALSG